MICRDCLRPSAHNAPCLSWSPARKPVAYCDPGAIRSLSCNGASPMSHPVVMRILITILVPVLLLGGCIMPPRDTPPSAPPPAPEAVPEIRPTVAGSGSVVNLRRGPSTYYPPVGQVREGDRVRVTGRNADGHWLQVVDPGNPESRLWIYGPLTDIDAATALALADVRAVAVDKPEAARAPEIVPETRPTVAGSGSVVNLRRGPSTDHAPVGQVREGDRVRVTGRNADGHWLQVVDPGNPEGRLWIYGPLTDIDAATVLAFAEVRAVAADKPEAARATLNEPLLVDAKARLGRGWVEAGQYSPDGSRLAVRSSAGLWLFDARTYQVESLITGYFGEDTYVVFSPDGRILASFGYRGFGTQRNSTQRNSTIRLWDAATGTLRHTLPSRPTLPGHRYKVAYATFSPDGRILASVSEYGTVRLWDTETGSLRHTLRLRGRIRVAFSPDSRTLAIARGDGIQLWDAATGTFRHTLIGYGDRVDFVVFSPDGRTLASVESRRLRLWDAAAGTLRHTLDLPGSVRAVAFSPDGRTLAGAGWDWGGDTIYLWDAATGSLRHTLDLPSPVYLVAFSPDGRTLASSSRDRTVRLWDVATVTLRHTLDLPRSVRAVAFSPDDRTLASFSWDIVQLWDTATGSLRHALDFSGPVAVTFSPDGRTLASAEWDRIRWWDAATGSLRHTLDFASPVRAVAFSPDGHTLASSNVDALDRFGTVDLWDANAGTLRYTLEGRSVPRGVAFSPDGRTFATNGTFATAGTVARDGSTDVGAFGTVRLWDTDTGVLRHTLDPRDNSHWSGSMAFSPDGRTLATAHLNLDEPPNTVHLWDVAAGTLRHTLTDYSARILKDYRAGILFSPDGRTLATIHSSKYRSPKVHLWDAATGSLRHTLDHKGPVSSWAFSPDGRTLASADGDSIRLWDAAAGTLRHTLTGHGATVNRVAFSPDGRTLASGGADRVVHLWRTSPAGILRHTLRLTGSVSSLAFSPDGRTLASRSGDGTVLLWDVVADAAAGAFRNLEANPGGQWAVWRSGTMVTANFSSPRARVQYDARPNPQPQFVLPEGFRPANRVTHTVAGTRVHADGTPVPNAPPATFDLTISPNGEVHYLDNPKVDGPGYVGYRVTYLTWPTREVPETPATSGPEPNR